jgi:predicted nucleic acid-binding Zn ribbon protein
VARLGEPSRRGRRRGPRELSHALRALRAQAAPPTLLAAVQERWAEVVGARIAGEAAPVSERGGVVTVACRSAVWAAELSMLATGIEQGLNEALGAVGRVRGLRFSSGGRQQLASS